MPDIQKIQTLLKENKLDGWLLYNFWKSNPIALRVIELPEHLILTRRIFYFIPAEGEPQKLVHSIERFHLDYLPGEKHIYQSWQDFESQLAKILKGYHKIAMEYSPMNMIPYLSLVDAGTIELVRKTGVEIFSSADLVQEFEARWNDEQFQGHIEAGKILIETLHQAFQFIKESVLADKRITEFDVQQFMLSKFNKYELETNFPPNCSVNKHSADPHYEPTENIHAEIYEGDFVLIDLWAKKKTPHSVYADYTWTGFVGESIPEKYTKIFEIVKGARNSAIKFLQENYKKDKILYGWQVDKVCRDYITERGYGDNFLHRTGHSIGEDLHGRGANIDNLETKDNRKLIPQTCFSIEPGIYIQDDFGIRSEIDVYLSKSYEVIITGTPIQEKLLTVLT